VNVEKNVIGEITKNSWVRHVIARCGWHYFSWALLKILTQFLYLWFGIGTCAFEVSLVFSTGDFQPSCGVPAPSYLWVPGALSPGKKQLGGVS